MGVNDGDVLHVELDERGRLVLEKVDPDPVQRLLQAGRGLYGGVDGVDYQRALRREWAEREPAWEARARTNCFLYAFDSADTARGSFVAQQLLQGGPRWISSLVLAELLLQPYGLDEPAHAEALRRALEALPGLTIAPVTASLAQAAARLRGALRISLPDAVVLATALSAGALLTTNDRGLCEAAGADAAVLDELIARRG